MLAFKMRKDMGIYGQIILVPDLTSDKILLNP